MSQSRRSRSSQATSSKSSKPRIRPQRVCFEPLEERRLLSVTLAQSGVPLSTIIVARDPSIAAAYAATELQYSLKQVTGATIPIVTDDQVVSGAKILVGDSLATQALGYSNDSFSSQQYMVNVQPGGTANVVLMGNDSSRRNIATVYGNLSLSAGPTGLSHAMTFDGNSAVAVANSGFTDAAGTMEAWVMFSGAAGSNYAGQIMRVAGNGYHYLDRSSSDQVRYRVYDTTGTIRNITSAALSLDIWHHVMATHDTSAGLIRLFIDGVSQGTDSYAGTASEDAPLSIGGYVLNGNLAGNMLVGSIDEVRISSVVRQTANFTVPAQPLAADPDTPLLMHFDNLSGSALGNPAGTIGQFDNAIGFNGTSATTVTSPGFTDAAGTMEARVMFSGAAGSNYAGTIFRVEGGSPWNYHIVDRTAADHVRYVVYQGGVFHTVTSAASLSLNVWHHVMATHDASIGLIRLFIDGVSQGTDSYTATNTNNPRLQLGGMASGTTVYNGLIGSIDEVRISSIVRQTGNFTISSQPYGPDAGTTLLMHYDYATGFLPGVLLENQYDIDSVTLPDFYEAQGTVYAVLDFLEQYGGVEWYNPTPTGSVYWNTPTLTVSGGNVVRTPSYTTRAAGIPDDQYYIASQTLWNSSTHSAEYNAYVNAAYQGASWGQKGRDIQQFLLRMRQGGTPDTANHSLYGYYNRFHITHPQWFVNPNDPNSQLNYTSVDLINQVAQDAADYYSGVKTGADLGMDWLTLPNPYPIVPMDNNYFSPADQLAGLWSNNTSGYFSSGTASDYVFTFVNAVAVALHAMPGHADDAISTLAYMSWADVPTTVTLNPGVEVQFCFTANRMPYGADYNHEVGLLQAWKTEAAASGRKLGLWLYPTFPNEIAVNKGFHQFPGYYADAIASQFNLFGDSFSTIYDCGWQQEVEAFVSLRLMVDSSLDATTLRTNYFDGVYGPAAGAMRNFYTLVQNTYTNPANYPPDAVHQTQGIAYGWLGSAAVMNQLQTYIDEAISAAGSNNPYATNVNAFQLGTWNYMLAGRADFLATYAAPAIALTSPQNNQVYYLSDPITLSASAAASASSNTGFTIDSAAIPTGWHYVAATHDANANRMELFVDGVSQGAQPYTPSTIGNATLKIGGYYIQGAVVNGLVGGLDDLRLSSVARDAAATYAQAVNGPLASDPDTTVLLHLDGPLFNEAPGETSYGTPSFTPSGIWNDAAEFAGTDAVYVTNPGFNDLTGTLESWVYFDGSTNNTNGQVMRLDGVNPWTYHILQRTSSGVEYKVYTTGALRVDYYENGHFLGSADTTQSNFIWQNASLGTHLLTAVVTDLASNLQVTSNTMTVEVIAPTVTVMATTPTATEAGTTGVFTITRTSTGGDLAINYTVTGSATSGGDYTALTGTATILNGQTSTAINVTPINDTAAELQENVIVILTPDAGYVVGSPSSATVNIADNDTIALPTSLTTYFRLDEGTGTSVADTATSGSTASTGTLTNGPLWTAGRVGNAVQFDGSNDYIAVSDSTGSDLDVTRITASVWVKADAGSTSYNKSYCFLSKASAYSMGTTSSNSRTVAFRIYIGGSAKVASYTIPSGVNLDEWHLFTGTYDGTNVRLHMDGTQVAISSNTSGNITVNNNALYLGRISGNYFRGALDEARIYNAAMNDADIAALYNQPALSVTNLTVNSPHGSGYSVQSNALSVGDNPYGDDTATFTSIPTRYLGSTYIQTANADANSTGSNLISLTVNQPVTISILYNDAYGTLPAWMASSGFTDTGDNISTTLGTFSVFTKTVSAGTFILGGNTDDGLGTYGMYSVLITPLL